MTPSPQPFAPPPGPPPRRGAAPRSVAPRRRWSWLEWFLIAQTFLPALLFVPGITPVRVLVRVASFLVALATWAAVVLSGRAAAGAGSFKANGCLKLVVGWLLLSLIHPYTNSLASGLALVMLYVAVISPAFWAPRLLSSPGQIQRMMAVLLVCNGLSAIVGLGQVFRPDTFNPPVIPTITDVSPDTITALAGQYTDQYGRKIIRPCGLSDQVGAAAGAGATAGLIGLAWALRPIGLMKRLACIGLSFCGVAVIYYSQVRMTFMMLIICLVVLVVIFALQKNFGYATLLGGLGTAMVIGALAWVMATSGRVVVERFIGLATNDFSKTYEQSGRAGFVGGALQIMMWDSPLGQGLGRWGTIYMAFGDKSKKSIWVEVMIPALVVDGGIPLLLLYSLGAALAVANTLRIALRSKDREIGFWAAVIFASELSILATCFSYVTFVTTIGMQFWFLAAVIHAADYRVRVAAARRPRPAPAPPPRPPGWPPPAASPAGAVAT